MQIIRDYNHVLPPAQKAVVAIGNFDGLHLGHAHVINTARAIARAVNVPLAVMSFDPHPRCFFKPETGCLRILRFAEKARILRAWGVDILFLMRFTKAFSELSAEGFVEQVLARGLKASHVVTGDNFIFGHKRSGNSDTLRILAERYGMGYTIASAVEAGDALCSSTRVREALLAGDMEKAKMLLGRPYSLTGRVVKGAGRGKGLGYPTANIQLPKTLLPKLGIYAVTIHTQDGVKKGAASLGTNPVFGNNGVTLEVYLLEDNKNRYGEKLEVAFKKYLREEIKFDSVDALKIQMAEDVERARNA